ncbi:hypothetical protein ACH4S8_37445 [Streptomyces sp. NPDC021080]|uniref:hypothetical protein n=1 Tax=Streptomyces sp. NPDC021080 TaxID=3365110 RepID=UPI0037B88560
MLRDLGAGARALLYTVLGILALALLTALGIYAFGTVQNETADYRGRRDVREKTVANADFRIGTYEQFFDLCQSTQAAEAAIKNALQELDTTNPSDDRKAQLQQVITAQRNTRADSITTYNSKASQNHREAFLDADLPYRLDVNAKETQCAA